MGNKYSLVVYVYAKFVIGQDNFAKKTKTTLAFS